VPRKNRRDRTDEEALFVPSARADAPMWAAVPGHEVRSVGAQKEYRCPGCDHPIRKGVWHLVVVPRADPDERRHWHTECWRSELRRTGHSGAAR